MPQEEVEFEADVEVSPEADFEAEEEAEAEAEVADEEPPVELEMPESYLEFDGCFLGSFKLPEEEIVTAGEGADLDSIEFTKIAWDKTSSPTLKEGYRLIYVDELLNNEEFNAKI